MPAPSPPPVAFAPGAGAPPLPSPAQVVELQSVREYPCLSVLLSTTPAPQMTSRDALTLRGLVESARSRLRAEGLTDDAATGVARLERLASEVAAGPAGAAVALFAGRGTSLAAALPVPVRDRVVVDPTFATRDLVRALHRTPRHVVLLLAGRDARLLDGAAGALRPAPTTSFPMSDERERERDPRRPGLRDADAEAFYRQVDRALGTYLRLHPAPLVLAGPQKSLAAFQRVSRNLGRLAGTVAGGVGGESLEALSTRVAPVLESYLLGRQAEALELLERRAGASRSVVGMPSCWLAARRERPEMLAVEEGLFYPARLSDDGDLLQPAPDVEHPDVIDDAVDELIEMVLDRGGWVALVEDGALAEHERVALTLRDRD